MKIVVLSTVHDIRDPRLSIKTAGSLARLGHRVTLIARTTSDATSEAINTFSKQLPPGTEISLLTTPSGRFTRLRRIKEAYTCIANRNPDLLYIHDPELIPAAELLRSRTGIPYVFDLHEDVFDRASGRNRSRLHTRGSRFRFLARDGAVVSGMIRTLVRLALISADGIVTAFDLGSRPWHPVPEVPHLTMLNLYPFDIALPDRSDDLPPKRAAYRLCYTGTLAPDRNITGLIRLTELIRDSGLDVELVIAGKVFLPFYLAELHQAIRHSPHSDHLHLIGGTSYVDWFTLQQLHRSSDAGCMYYDPDVMHWPYPTKLYEYFSHRLPVICSPVKGLAQTIHSLHAGAVVPYDDPDLAAKLITEKLPLICRMDMAEARHWAFENGSWHAYEAPLDNFITEAAKKRKKFPPGGKI